MITEIQYSLTLLKLEGNWQSMVCIDTISTGD